MKKLLISFLFFVTIQVFGQECHINLENFNTKIKVQDFYIENIVKNDPNQYKLEDGSVIDAVTAFKKFGHSRDSRRTQITENDLGSQNSMDVENPKIIARLYSKVLYSEADKAVCFGAFWFPYFSILASDVDDFIAFVAVNERMPENDFKTYLQNLEKTYKFAKSETQNFDIETFDFGNYFLKVKLKTHGYANEVRALAPGEIIEKTVNIELQIVKKNTDEKLIKWLGKYD